MDAHPESNTDWDTHWAWRCEANRSINNRAASSWSYCQYQDVKVSLSSVEEFFASVSGLRMISPDILNIAYRNGSVCTWSITIRVAQLEEKSCWHERGILVGSPEWNSIDNQQMPHALNRYSCTLQGDLNLPSRRGYLASLLCSSAFFCFASALSSHGPPPTA